MNEIDAREMAEQVGLGDIAWCLDFINKAPEEHRGNLVLQIRREVYAYQQKKAGWEEHKEEMQQGTKEDKRFIRSLYKNRLNATMEFLVYLNSAADYNEENEKDEFGFGDFKISEAARLEVMQLLLRLKIADESNAIEEILKKKSLSQPTKKRVETLIREIHKVYKITGISDTLKALLPLI